MQNPQEGHQESITWQQFIEEMLGDYDINNAIPGGFGSDCEFSEELEAALQSLIAMVREGMTVQEQSKVTYRLLEAMAEIKVDRASDD